MPGSPTAPQARPIAFLSDIHGNLEALEAVLSELARREVRDVVAAGDLLLGGDKPLEVWRRLQRAEARCTRGVSDTALATVDPASLRPTDHEQAEKARAFTQTRRKLGELVLEQLRRLPEQLRIPMLDGGEILVVHGAPSDPTAEIGHDLSEDEVLALLGDDPADVVVCGATHVPCHRELDGVVVVNVGSVGASPEGRMAHFTIVTPRMDGPELEQAWVEY